MKSIAVIIAIIVNGITYGQKLPYKHFNDSILEGHMDLSIGLSSIGGYDVIVGYGMGKKSNVFHASLGMDSQVGQVKYGLLTPTTYNDKFYHFELLYGRVFQHKRFVTTINAGPQYHFYKNKSAHYVYADWGLSHYEVITKSYQGFGLVLRPTFGFVIGRKNLLGIEGNLYLNQSITVMSVNLNYRVVF